MPGRPPQALLHSARPLVAAGLAVYQQEALILLVGRNETAQHMVEQLSHFLPPAEAGGPPLHLFAEPDALAYERIHWSDRTRQQRLTTLAALQSRNDPPPVVVASARALMQKTLPARELRLALRPLNAGSYVQVEQLANHWVQTGYNPADVVEEPGTFARRGGIVDIWPPNLPHPVRIDLFGDEVESLRIFDPTTQRTERQVERVEIGPGSEALSKYGPTVLERLNVRGDSLMSTENIGASGQVSSLLHDPSLLLAVREEIRLEVERLHQGQSFRGIEWYLPYLYVKPASLLDYLTNGATLVVDDGADLMDALSELEDQAGRLQEELVKSGELPRGFASSFFSVQELHGQLLDANPIILGFGDLDGMAGESNTPLARHFAPGPRFAGKTKQIQREIAKIRESNQAAVLVTRQAKRLQEQFADADIITHVQADLMAAPVASVTLVQGILSEGFVVRGLGAEESPEATQEPGEASQTAGGRALEAHPWNRPAFSQLHFFTDGELFGWTKAPARKRSQVQSKIAAELFFADVKPGDYVVHLEHGIGQYAGLVKLEVGGEESRAEREYLQVNYSQGDKLYVPVHQADRLSRYVGGENLTPPVTRLGSADWQIVKERARKAVAEIAEDLLALYAERELARGHAFSPDGPWQEELEESFPFQETEDQLVAIAAVKQDMESEQPMDRLICGDVGYGKTEVAVRAAFKAILDGKQAAVLVPTTVLAQQHFRTFSRRMAPYPVRVEMLSRFRTSAQQEQVLKGLMDGSVDMVVGTHRLLSQDITFKDLGLLVVDEEQRFGVSHKERLKQLRTQVDVLTLSATPIPRTLHMSLSGIRDMSTISTPPQERMPVRTILSEYDEVLVRQAIQREMERGGQVFVIHNRVQGIEQVAARVRHQVPEARVAVGHGQMPERRLENVMIQFAEGEIDVLVSTTIVENGLDIRNANTMIVNRADHFGLAQLYQLRGRVGRSAVRGYCYLLYDKHKTLAFDARRRLEALLESSEELGAGFRIAMRDLEIRGAGELLGARQHGHIATVGFDLYTRLLTQAINDARRKKKRFDELTAEAGDGEETAQDATTVGIPPSRSAAARPTTAQGRADDLPLPFALDDPLAPPVTLDLPLVAEIPEEYVPDQGLRLQIYRRIAGLASRDEIDAMRQELVDRFGQDLETKSAPEAVENLLYQIWIKILALKAGIQAIGRRLDQLAIMPASVDGIDRQDLQRQLRTHLGRISAEDDTFVPNTAVHVGKQGVYLPIDDEERWRTDLVKTLELMAYERPERT